MAKIYELTTNWEDGFRKIYVVNVKNDTEAKRLAKKGFGKFFWAHGISFYDRTEDAKKRGMPKYWISKSEFLKITKRLR